MFQRYNLAWPKMCFFFVKNEKGEKEFQTVQDMAHESLSWEEDSWTSGGNLFVNFVSSFESWSLFIALFWFQMAPAPSLLFYESLCWKKRWLSESSDRRPCGFHRKLSRAFYCLSLASTHCLFIFTQGNSKEKLKCWPQRPNHSCCGVEGRDFWWQVRGGGTLRGRWQVIGWGRLIIGAGVTSVERWHFQIWVGGCDTQRGKR